MGDIIHKAAVCVVLDRSRAVVWVWKMVALVVSYIVLVKFLYSCFVMNNTHKEFISIPLQIHYHFYQCYMLIYYIVNNNNNNK